MDNPLDPSIALGHLAIGCDATVTLASPLQALMERLDLTLLRTPDSTWLELDLVAS